MNKLFAIIAVFGLAFVFSGWDSSAATSKTGSEPAKTDAAKTDAAKTDAATAATPAKSS